MSAALPLQYSPLGEVHAALDAAASVAIDAMSASSLAQALRETERAITRLTSLKMRILSEAERAGTAKRSGAASTSEWAAKHTRSDGVAAARQVRLATDLGDAVATTNALADGDVSAKHAEVIVRAGKQLPESLSRFQRAKVERHLLDKAKVMAPGQLRKVARRAIEAAQVDAAQVDAHEEQVVASEEERARAQTKLTFHDNEDGTISGHFTLPVLQGRLLEKIIHSMTAPRRRSGSSAANRARGSSGSKGTFGCYSAEDVGALGTTFAHRAASITRSAQRTEWANARGLALCELIEHLPTDHLPTKVAATMIVTVDEAVLRGRLAVAGTDTGDVISAGEVRRLACNAGIIPMVMNGRHQDVDAGREKRLFTELLRTLLASVYTSCAAEDCDRPYAWCELHHLIPWSKGGRSTKENAVPLCHTHHQMIHQPGRRSERLPTGEIRFAPLAGQLRQ